MEDSRRFDRLSILPALAVFLLALITGGYSQNDNSPELVDKVAARMAGFPDIKDFEAEVSSMLINVDKNWKTKKTTLVEKIVRSRGGVREEEILSAVEMEKGRRKDVTRKVREETRKQQDKARKEREKRKKKGQEEAEGGGHRRDLTLEQMLPFSEDKRQGYTFRQREDTSYEGKTVRVLESRAKVRSDKFFEGTYYIDPDSYEVLRAFIQPAKNPGPLKKMEMEFLFQISPEGLFFVKETRVRVHVGLVIKNIRMEVQELYKNFKALEPEIER
jgi:hypothetical protein